MRDRHPTHGYDHSFRHGLSGTQIAAIKAKGGFQPAGKGALPKNPVAPKHQTAARVINPKVPNAPARAPLAAPMSKKQIAAKPLSKLKAPPKPAAPAANPAKSATSKTAKVVTPKHRSTGKTNAPHKKPHVNVGQVLGRVAGAAKAAVQTAVVGTAAEAVIKKSGRH